jgi:hypothetical protein
MQTAKLLWLVLPGGCTCPCGATSGLCCWVRFCACVRKRLGSNKMCASYPTVLVGLLPAGMIIIVNYSTNYTYNFCH